MNTQYKEGTQLSIILRSIIRLKTRVYSNFLHQVMYWEDDTKPDTIGKVRITGNHTAANLTGLRADTAYYLSVAAFNTAGPGPQSAPINTTTKKPRECVPRGDPCTLFKNTHPSFTSFTQNCSVFSVIGIALLRLC